MTIKIELIDSEPTQNVRRSRTEAQVKAEQKSEQHRIHKKISANFKRNATYAEKFMRYKNNGTLNQLIVDALMNAPDDPNDYIPTFDLKKHNLD